MSDNWEQQSFIQPSASSTWMATPKSPHPLPQPTPAWTTATSQMTTAKIATNVNTSALNTMDAPVILMTLIAIWTHIAHNASSNLKVCQSDKFSHLHSFSVVFFNAWCYAFGILSQIFINEIKQARKPRSYASPKLWPSDLLTGVKCRATSVAKK